MHIFELMYVSFVLRNLIRPVYYKFLTQRHNNMMRESISGLSLHYIKDASLIFGRFDPQKCIKNSKSYKLSFELSR